MLFGKEVALTTPLTLDTDRRRPAAMVGTLTVSIDTRSVTREYAVNASNFRFWDDAIKAYVID